MWIKTNHNEYVQLERIERLFISDGNALGTLPEGIVLLASFGSDQAAHHAVLSLLYTAKMNRRMRREDDVVTLEQLAAAVPQSLAQPTPLLDRREPPGEQDPDRADDVVDEVNSQALEEAAGQARAINAGAAAAQDGPQAICFPSWSR